LQLISDKHMIISPLKHLDIIIVSLIFCSNILLFQQILIQNIELIQK